MEIHETSSGITSVKDSVWRTKQLKSFKEIRSIAQILAPRTFRSDCRCVTERDI